MIDAIQAMDGALLLMIQNVRIGALNPLVEVYSSLGNLGLVWIAVSVGMLISRKTRKVGAISLLALILGTLFTNVALKNLVARPRPWLDVAGLTPLIHPIDPNSFPSGHTCAAFAAGTVWHRLLQRRLQRGLALTLAVLMGLSRLYLGVHYPTDVICGALVGCLSGWLALKLARLWTERREENRNTDHKG